MTHGHSFPLDVYHFSVPGSSSWRNLQTIKLWFGNALDLCLVGYVFTSASGLALMVVGNRYGLREIEGPGLLMAMTGSVFMTLLVMLIIVAIVSGIGGGGIRIAKACIRYVQAWQTPIPRPMTA